MGKILSIFKRVILENGNRKFAGIKSKRQEILLTVRHFKGVYEQWVEQNVEMRMHSVIRIRKDNREQVKN